MTMSNHPRFLFVFKIIVLMSASVWVPPIGAQNDQAQFIDQLPPAMGMPTGFYALNDVLFSLDAHLSWNALLQKGMVQTDQQRGVNFSFLVGSRKGISNGRLVDWPDPPVMRAGEVFLSRAFLDLALREYENPNVRRLTPINDEQPTSEWQTDEELLEPPEEPPWLTETTSTRINTLLFLACVNGDVIETETGDHQLTLRLGELLAGEIKSQGIELVRQTWPSAEAADSSLKVDAVLACQVFTKLNPNRTGFFYYDSGRTTVERQRSPLVEWSRASQVRQADSIRLAEKMLQAYQQEIGAETRTVGIRCGPMAVLQGHQVPAVLLSLEVASSSPEWELKQTAQSLGLSLLSQED